MRHTPWTLSAARALSVALPLALPLALLGGCGGGGGDSGGSGTVDAATAWRNLLSGTRSYDVSGTGSDGRVYSMTLGIAPGGSAIFPVTGQTASRAVITATIRTGGASVTGTTSYYHDAQYALIGAQISAGGSTSCAVVQSFALPPAAVRPGASGALATLNELASCASGAAVVGSESATWSVETDPVNGATYFCLNSSTRSGTGTVESSESDCVEVGAGGNLGSRARVTVSFDGFTVTGRN